MADAKYNRDDYYTVKEVIGITGRDKSTISRWISSGKIAAIKDFSGRVFIPKEEIDSKIFVQGVSR